MSVARHTAYNLAGAILPVGVSLVTVPLYLKAIGLERYGVLALVWVLAGYFNFFDFGIGRATARKMATLGAATAEARNRLFWTSAAITGVLALVAGLLFWPIAALLLGKMDIPGAMRPELSEALPLLIAAVPIGVVQSLMNGTLEGRRAFGPLNGISLTGNVLTAMLPLATAWTYGPRLALLISATLSARVLVLLAQLECCRRLVPLGRPQRDGKREMTDLLKFGGWVTVSGIISPILVYFDRFAIGALLGAAAVGFYVIGYNLISQLQVVPLALSRAIFPRFAELAPEQSRAEAQVAFRILLASLTPITLAGMALVTPFLSLWVGERVASTTGPLTILLLLGFWINSLALLNFARIQAVNRPDLTAKAHVAELLPYTLLLWVGLHTWGLMGTALAWTARVTADFLILASLDGISRAQVRLLIAHGIILAIAAAGLLALPPAPALWALLALATITALVLAWRTAPNELWFRVKPILRRAVKA